MAWASKSRRAAVRCETGRSCSLWVGGEGSSLPTLQEIAGQQGHRVSNAAPFPRPHGPRGPARPLRAKRRENMAPALLFSTSHPHPSQINPLSHFYIQEAIEEGAGLHTWLSWARGAVWLWGKPWQKPRGPVGQPIGTYTPEWARMGQQKWVKFGQVERWRQQGCGGTRGYLWGSEREMAALAPAQAPKGPKQVVLAAPSLVQSLVVGN